MDRFVRVWTSPDAETWREVPVLAGAVDSDDICVLTPLRDGVAVLWSDQHRDEFALRRHVNGDAADRWSEKEVIARGGGIADDHLNTALAPDGTLWLVTKNSVDTPGQPQLSLHVRSPAGRWRSTRFAPRAETWEPTRPIVTLGPGGSDVFVGYTRYEHATGRPGTIIAARVDPLTVEVRTPHAVITPAPGTILRVNNVTGPRLCHPAGAPWLLLASDDAGQIFETDLRALP